MEGRGEEEGRNRQVVVERSSEVFRIEGAGFRLRLGMDADWRLDVTGCWGEMVVRT